MKEKAHDKLCIDKNAWNPKEFYKYDVRISPNIECLKDIDDWFIDNAPYYSKFKKLAGNEKWQHVDLFFYRMTNQREFVKKIFLKNKTELNHFGRRQLELTWEAIKKSKPKVIIVVNARASSIIKTFTGDKFVFDEKKGYHIFQIEDKETPIFFSSM